ncbi:hypothetical protein [Psychrobacter sp. I-STPA10]|uniref:hypothetical protein n=1 Tax=Psychrobacter sp. I-STPA10 TaxID=2585769 RepID=UPI001E4AC530|nr:hypothetical protein [Psychrobacter sp. I-STPA10]
MSSLSANPDPLAWLSYFQTDHTATDTLQYDLPDGHLSLYKKTVSIKASGSIKKQDIFLACNRVIKQTMQQQIRQALFGLSHSKHEVSHSVLVIDVKVTKGDQTKGLAPEFGAKYFKEHFFVELSDTEHILHVFSRVVWLDMLTTLQTPCELWRFLEYHQICLQQAIRTGSTVFSSEKELLADFMTSHDIFKKAITVDNALINYKLKLEPNPILVAMASTQQPNSATARMSYEHMSEASKLWTQLCLQMNLQLPKATTYPIYEMPSAQAKTASQMAVMAEDEEKQQQNSLSWIRELLAESLFSRYELIKELYLYPKQPEEMKKSGYVVHQHSYESLGRHYMMIFYGNETNSTNSRLSIQPRLQEIAKDIANRLTIPELHHVVILGVEFLQSEEETVMDLDVFIQTIDTMTEKERFLSEQLDMLRVQQSESDTQTTQAKDQTPVGNSQSKLSLNPNSNHPTDETLQKEGKEGADQVKLPSLNFKMKY